MRYGWTPDQIAEQRWSAMIRALLLLEDVDAEAAERTSAQAREAAAARAGYTRY